MRRLAATLFALAVLGGVAVTAAAAPVQQPAPAQAVGPRCFTDAGEVMPCSVGSSEPAPPAN